MERRIAASRWGRRRNRLAAIDGRHKTVWESYLPQGRVPFDHSPGCGKSMPVRGGGAVTYDVAELEPASRRRHVALMVPFMKVVDLAVIGEGAGLLDRHTGRRTALDVTGVEGTLVGREGVRGAIGVLDRDLAPGLHLQGRRRELEEI